jgi:CelD/BcsL family acetyltransferase involved in cellulose biosynthesis
MRPNLRLVLYRQIPEDQKFAEQWNQLVFAMEHPEVFYTYEWALAVSRAYKSGTNPLLFAGYRGDALVGIVALSTGSEGEQVSFLAGATADYCNFVSAPDDRDEFVQLAIEELRRMGFAEQCFANVPSESITVGVLAAALRDSTYSVFARPAYGCARVVLNTPEDRKQTSSSAIRKLRRTRAGGLGSGQITVFHGARWEEINAEFAQFALAHIGRFLGTGKLSNLVHSQRRVFLLNLAKLLSARQWLTISTLKLDGRTIAWNYGFRFAGSWFWYQPAFDNEQQHLSPGTRLLCEILHEASTDPGISTVDLGLGDEGYKQRYANSTRQTLCIAASRSKLRMATQACRYRIAELIKKHPPLERRIRNTVSRAMAVRADAGRRGVRKYFRERLSRMVVDCTEVLFFECNGQDFWTAQEIPNPSSLEVKPLSIELLAKAAMTYPCEEETLKYLLRSAKRLASGESGFALVADSGGPLHFCWVAPFDGFKMTELGHVLQEPASGAVLLFDCWTPISKRGRGYYGLCVSQVAARLLASGKKPWIFSAATNSASARALQRAGFVQRFSLIRSKKFLVNRVSISAKQQPEPRLDLTAA